MNTLETRSITLTSLEVRDDQKAVGLAAPFNSDSVDLGRFVERIAKGAFTRSLEAVQAGTLNVYALWAHDNAQPVASTRSGKLKLTQTDRGLEFEMDVTRLNDMQRSALEDGDLQMSFGFIVREENWRENDDGSIEREIVDCDLTEVSFVVNPAYPATAAALRSLDAWKAEQEQVEVKPDVDTTELWKRLAMAELDLRAPK